MHIQILLEIIVLMLFSNSVPPYLSCPFFSSDSSRNLFPGSPPTPRVEAAGVSLPPAPAAGTDDDYGPHLVQRTDGRLSLSGVARRLTDRIGLLLERKRDGERQLFFSKGDYLTVALVGFVTQGFYRYGYTTTNCTNC